MILQLKELYDKLKNIKTYLIKIGPKRRQGQIVINKLEEAKIFYDEYTLLISELNKDIKEGRLSTQDTDLVIKLSSEFQSLYTDIEFLCTKHKSSDFKDKFSDMTETNVNMAETFNLKTALSLLAQMNDDEFNTKQLIDNIEYYASVLEKDECKHKLIQFVLKSRLSQGAKLKIKCSYSTVTDLINDMRKELLPQKSAPAIQDKLQKCRQNNLNIQDYGKEITEMFVELTIAQSSGNSDCYNILKPLNEKYAIKKFADGLRNRRLSTVITSRNYSSLKDAIQAAMEEDIGSASTSAGEILGMSHQNYNKPTSHTFSSPRRQNYHRGGQHFNSRVFSQRTNYNPNFRGQNQVPMSAPRPVRRPWQKRGMYNNNNNRRGNRWNRNQHMRVITETENNSDVAENKFFRG